MSNLVDKKFPTGKPHVSFSEIKIWKECSWKHKLTYIDKVDMFEPSPYLDFGTAVHEGCENLLKNRNYDENKILTEMKSAWDKNDFENPEWYSRQPSWYKHQPYET